MIIPCQTFSPPVFVVELRRASELDWTHLDSIGLSDEGWSAYYVIDQEILDLLMKRQPVCVYGSLPSDLNNVNGNSIEKN